MSKKQKKMLIRIIVALVVFIACEIAEKLIHLNGVWDTVVKAAMFAVPYLMAGYERQSKISARVMYLTKTS